MGAPCRAPHLRFCQPDAGRFAALAGRNASAAGAKVLLKP